MDNSYDATIIDNRIFLFSDESATDEMGKETRGTDSVISNVSIELVIIIYDDIPCIF